MTLVVSASGVDELPNPSDVIGVVSCTEHRICWSAQCISNVVRQTREAVHACLHALVACGLRSSLEQSFDVRTLGEFCTAQQANAVN